MQSSWMYTEPGDKWLECSPSEGIEGLCFTVSSIGVSNLPEQPDKTGVRGRSVLGGSKHR